MLRFFVLILTLVVAPSCSAGNGSDDNNNTGADKVCHFVFVSDSHYGLFRQFDGQPRSSEYVNSVMVDAINSLPATTLPDDGGVGGNGEIKAIEMVVNGGDIANRQETGIQSASESWAQFQSSFINRIAVKNAAGSSAEIFVIPGNHDVSNAIGYYKPMSPLTDTASMVGIYNFMNASGVYVPKENYDYAEHKVCVAADRFGVRFLFTQIWPGAAMREWIGRQVGDSGKPVVIFAHDPPAIEFKHFTNPTYPHDINSDSKYENLIPDMPERPGSSLKEQRDFAQWLAGHKTIRAYFHGHTNYNEFYTFTGPDDNVLLPTFRVDSPMKGKLSADDQSLLSFHVVSVDTQSMKMTVRECFWGRGSMVQWGAVKTIGLVD